jgi:hypothetical protein
VLCVCYSNKKNLRAYVYVNKLSEDKKHLQTAKQTYNVSKFHQEAEYPGFKCTSVSPSFLTCNTKFNRLITMAPVVSTFNLSIDPRTSQLIIKARYHSNNTNTIQSNEPSFSTSHPPQI